MALDDYFDQIESYLNNEMDITARQEFEKEIEENSDLKEYVLKMILANEAIGLSIEKDIRASVDKVRLEKSAQPKGQKSEVKVKRLFSPLRIAAGIALLITAGWVFTTLGKYSDFALTESYYQTAMVGTLKGDANPSVNLQDGLQALLKDKDFSKAISEFKMIPDSNESYPAAQYYLAHAYLLNGDKENAADQFEKIMNGPLVASFVDREEVEWNHVVSLIGTDEQKLNTSLENILSNKDHAFYKRALDLRKKLNSSWRKLR